MSCKLILEFLSKNGPSCSSKIKGFLIGHGLSEEAARKSISRKGVGINVFTTISLPKREGFLYLDKQYNTGEFWGNFVRDHIDKNSSYGVALGSLLCRGGITAEEHFHSQSGSPKVKKNHLSHQFVCEKLEEVKLIKYEHHDTLGRLLFINPQLGFDIRNEKQKEAELITENIMIKATVDWMKKTGFVSYNAIKARNDRESTYFGPYAWDITAPSYLLPLKTFNLGKVSSGFVLADVINSHIDSNGVQYFIRKCKSMSAMHSTKPFLPILIGTSFSEEAFKMAKSEGYLATTPRILFGDEIADAFLELTEMLTNAAAAAVSQPESISKVFNSLGKIEGAAINLKGPLFEMITAYLINKSEGYSVDIGKEIHDMGGNKAEIDVLAVLGKHSIKVMECKAKNVKNLVTHQEIYKWIKVRIPQIKQWIESQERFHSTTNVSFEYWTTSGYTEEAIKLINDYKPKKFNVEFKNGKDVLKYATETKEQSITNALKEHFFSHPLAKL